MLQTAEDFVKYDIHLVRLMLIHARIARQIGTIAKEFFMLNPEADTVLETAQEFLDEAKALRGDARKLLLEIERENGRLFVAGQPTVSLKDHLCGKFFKAWKEFDVEYARIGAPFFGRDPE